jgi:hypothetical protein
LTGRTARTPRWSAIVLVGALLASCSAGPRAGAPTTAAATIRPSTTAATTTTTAPTTTAAPPEVRLVAAGDLACKPGMAPSATECQAAATALLAESLHPDVVLTLGDEQYDVGRAEDFVESYERTWGRLKAITHPVPGNHEYAGGRATGYYAYFGDAAHGPDGWYSFDLPEVGWHVIVLNSECSAVGGCGRGSRQYEWLRSDLDATSSQRILAAWHHPRWSSGLHHSDATYEPFWQLLAAHGADLVLSGHDHHYERFAPDDDVVQLVVGTGGRNLYPAQFAEADTVVRSSDGFGVLELLLRPQGYIGAFRPVEGNPFSDSFSAGCG